MNGRTVHRLLALAIIATLFGSCSQSPSQSDMAYGYESGADKSLGESVHDAGLTTAVKLSLAFEPGVKASHIAVHTDHGTVTLTGEVGSESELLLALRTARATEGVKHVVNHLEVRG